MLINLSNHPSTRWSEQQQQTAIEQFGGIQDMPFPNIPPAWKQSQVQSLVIEYGNRILNTKELKAVHVMGEMTFVYQLVAFLRKHHVECVASTTERDTIDNPDGSKTFKFKFVQFRRYF